MGAASRCAVCREASRSLCAAMNDPREGTMRAFSLRARCRSLPNVFVQAWRRWTAARAGQLLEIARLGSDKLEYLTSGREMLDPDLGVVTGGRGDDLLRRRMLALELDPYELTLSDPALLHYLQGRCAQCESPDACESGLAHTSTNQTWQDRDDWRDYCENASALEMLVALRSRSTAAPKYQFPLIP
jgi:hypothetical protein